MADLAADPFPAPQLAEVLRLTVELTRSVAAMMIYPRTHKEWVDFTEARALEGWLAKAEPHLLTLANGFPKNLAVALAVDDFRAAIRRLAEFLPDLADDTSGEPASIYQDEVGELVEVWPYIPTEASRRLFQLIRADNRGRFRRLQDAVGQGDGGPAVTLRACPKWVLSRPQAAKHECGSWPPG